MIGEILEFKTPKRILFGNGAVRKVGVEAKKFGDKILIIAGKTVRKVGIVDKVRGYLEEEGLDVDIFDRVKPEPSIDVFKECIGVLKDYDLVVGIGGGSSLDVTKASSVLVKNEGDINDYIGINKIKKEGIPKILIPTTSGSGSEVSHITVLTDEKGNKNAIYSKYLFSDISIVDPELTLTLPKKVTANTGFDALTHAIESYVSLRSNELTDALALKAIELISKSLRDAVNTGNIESRHNMSMASMLAGMAFVNSSLGAVHALAYPLGVKYHLAHGESNALMLPYVMRFNYNSNPEKFDEIGKTMNSKDCIEAVMKLAEDVGIILRMRDFGVKKEDIKEFSEIAMKSKRLLEYNPREMRKEDARNIYEEAW